MDYAHARGIETEMVSSILPIFTKEEEETSQFHLFLVLEANRLQRLELDTICSCLYHMC